MTEPLRRVLVRLVNNDGAWSEIGYTLASEAIRRPVTVRTRREGASDADDTTVDGLVLIGEGGKEGYLSIEPIARMVGQHALKIARTPELLWLPVNARRNDMVDLWTVECVPLVQYFRLSQRTDQAVLRLSGVDPATGEILLPPEGLRCEMCGGRGALPGPFGDVVICATCGGNGRGLS